MIFATPKLNDETKEVLERIAVMRRQLKFATSTPRRWSGLLRRNTLARAIRGSNSIEGYKATVEDVIAAVEGEEPMQAGHETWMAVVGYRNAMTYVLQLARDTNFTYDAGCIRSLHYMMLSHDLDKNPGNWRPGAIFVRDEQQNKVVYEGPERELVEALIKEFVESLNEKNDVPYIIKAAMAHLNLVMIHPFSDGNGRMARCMQTLILAREGILEPVFCSIEEHLGRIQQEYYDILGLVGSGSWHPENDARPWVRFICKAHYTQASILAWRMKLLTRLWEEIQIKTDKRGLPERVVQPLVDAAIGLKVRNASYRHLAEISENLASRDLKTLVDVGYLKPTGENRGRLYEASSKLLAMRDKLYEPFKMEDPFTSKQLRLPGAEI
jgi:Fic family protein